jgi:hypothetical protein
MTWLRGFSSGNCTTKPGQAMKHELPWKTPSSGDLPAPDAAEAREQDWKHVDELRDEALRATFPASDAVAVGH